MKKRYTKNIGSKHGITSLFLIAFLTSSPVFGSDDNTQLDRIENAVDTIVTKQEKILDIIDEEPLRGKKFGIEINPIRLLALSTDEKTFSGSFSFFNLKPNVEISIPIFVSNTQLAGEDFSVFTIDGHYRYFLGSKTNGFYISGFSRLATLNGTFSNQHSWNENNESGRTYKLGAGFGIGYRIFSKSGLYWGASLSLGRYLIGNSNQYRSSYSDTFAEIDDEEFIFDVELFKFGYAF